MATNISAGGGCLFALDEDGNVFKDNKKYYDGYEGADLAVDGKDVYVLTGGGSVYKNDEELYTEYEASAITATKGDVYVACESGEVFKNDEKFYEDYEIQDMCSDGGDVYVLTTDGQVFKNDESLYEDYEAVALAAANGNVYVLTDNGEVWKNDECLFEDYAPLDISADGDDVYVLTESGRLFKNDVDLYEIGAGGDEGEEECDMHEVKDWSESEGGSGLDKTAKFMFERADENKNGSLDRDEVTAIFTELCENSGAPAPTAVLLAQAWDQMDKDGDSKVSLDEWRQFLKTAIDAQTGPGSKDRGEGVRKLIQTALASEEGRTELKGLFDSLDASETKDGKITLKEWSKAMGKQKELIAKFFGGATVAEMERIFKKLDTDKSSSLTWEEFSNAAMSLGAREKGNAKKPPKAAATE